MTMPASTRCPSHDQPGRPSAFADRPVGVTSTQLDTRLVLGSSAQDPFEQVAAASQADDEPRHAGHRRGHGSGRDHRLQHVGHLGGQGVDDLAAEAVGMVELHHTLTSPRPVRVRSGVAVDDHHPVVSTGQRDGEIQPGRAGPDDGDPPTAHPAASCSAAINALAVFASRATTSQAVFSAVHPTA